MTCIYRGQILGSYPIPAFNRSPPYIIFPCLANFFCITAQPDHMKERTNKEIGSKIITAM